MQLIQEDRRAPIASKIQYLKQDVKGCVTFNGVSAAFCGVAHDILTTIEVPKDCGVSEQMGQIWGGLI